jgi:TP901 family phage tail tape measure protein
VIQTGIKLIADTTGFLSGLSAAQNRYDNFVAQMGSDDDGSIRRMNMLLDTLPQRFIFMGMDLQHLSYTFTAAFTAPFIALTAASQKFAIDFENAMRNINSIAHLTEAQFQDLRQSILEITDTPTILQGPVEMAQGFYEIQSSGQEGAIGLNTLRVAAEGATAGLTDTATSVKLVVEAMNAFEQQNLTAQQVMDVSFQTVDKGILVFEDLARGLGVVMAPAARAGMGIQEIGAALIQMTRAGIQPANAMTYLSRAITSILDPSKEAQDLADKLGISLGNNAIRTQGFIGVLQQMQEATRGNATQMSTLIGEERAMRAVFSILRDGGIGYQKQLADLEKQMVTGGATARALSEQLKAPGAVFAELKKQAALAGIELGQTFLPATKLVVEGIANFAKAVRDVPDELKLTALAMGGLVAVFGPAIFAVSQLVMAKGALMNVSNYLQMKLVAEAEAEAALAAAAAEAAAAVEVEAVAQEGLAVATEHATAALAAETAAEGSAGAAAVTTAGEIGALATAEEAATAGAVSLGSALTVLSGIGVVLAVAGIAAQIKDSGEKSRIAALSVRDLVFEYKKVKALESQQTDLDLPSEVPWGAMGPDASSNLYLKQLQAMPDDVETALTVMDGIREQLEAKAEEIGPSLNDKVEKAFLEGVSLSPEVARDAAEALLRVQQEGFKAFVNTPWMEAGDAIKKPIKEYYDMLKTALEAPGIAADEEISSVIKRQMQEIEDRVGTMEIKVPITIDYVVKRGVASYEGVLTQTRLDAANALDALTRKSELEERQIKINRMAYEEQNFALEDARHAYSNLQDSVSELRDALGEAEDAVDRFSNPSLVGMKALEDEIFALTMDLAGLQLQMLDIELAWDPVINAASKNVLQLRLAMLEAGDAADELGKKGKRAMFDVAEAQRRELQEGVPVMKQFLDWQKQQEERNYRRDDTPEKQAYEAAQKELEILQIKKQLALFDLQAQEDSLEKQQKRLDLNKRITYDPQLKVLKDMADTEEEITFEEAVTGLAEALNTQKTIKQQLEEQEEALKGQEKYVKSLEETQWSAQRALNKQNLEHDRTLMALDDEKAWWDEIIDKITDAQTRLQSINTMKFDEKHLDVKVKEPIQAKIQFQYMYGSMEQEQRDDATPGLFDWVKDLQNWLSTHQTWQPFAPNGGYPMQGGQGRGYETGGVVPGPPGAPMPAIVHGGERFLGNTAPVTNETWNVNVANNYPHGDPILRLRREARMRRLQRRWMN